MTLTDDEKIRLAATAVMGWEAFDRTEDIVNTSYPYVYECEWQNNCGNYVWVVCRNRRSGIEPWNPITNWANAGEIVDKMHADGWKFYLSSGEVDPSEWCAFFLKEAAVGNYHGAAQHFAKPAQRAITTAALLAVKAITEEQTMPGATGEKRGE